MNPITLHLLPRRGTIILIKNSPNFSRCSIYRKNGAKKIIWLLAKYTDSLLSVIVIYVGIVNKEELTSLYFQKTAINVFRLDFKKDVTEKQVVKYIELSQTTEMKNRI